MSRREAVRTAAGEEHAVSRADPDGRVPFDGDGQAAFEDALHGRPLRPPRRVGRLGTGRHRDVGRRGDSAETWRDAAEAIFATASTPAPHPRCPAWAHRREPRMPTCARGSTSSSPFPPSTSVRAAGRVTGGGGAQLRGTSRVGGRRNDLARRRERGSPAQEAGRGVLTPWDGRRDVPRRAPAASDASGS